MREEKEAVSTKSLQGDTVRPLHHCHRALRAAVAIVALAVIAISAPTTRGQGNPQAEPTASAGLAPGEPGLRGGEEPDDLRAGPLPANAAKGPNTKGSLLYFPNVEIKWNALGEVTQTTVIELSNDYPGDVHVLMYFVNGDAPTPAVTVFGGGIIERAHAGWNFVDNQILLTQHEPTFWDVVTGQPKGVVPFGNLDPGIPQFPLPGRPDPEVAGGRMVRGFIVAWAVTIDGHEITWNHLRGNAMIVNYADQSAWQYDAAAFRALGVEGQPTMDECGANPGRLKLDGIEYQTGYERLLFEFMTPGTTLSSGPRSLLQVDTDLTLLPMTLDFRATSQHPGSVPTTTWARFDIWNQNEIRFSGTSTCISCWHQAPIGSHPQPNHFRRDNIQTDAGKARVTGMWNPACGETVQEVAMVGVAARMLEFPNNRPALAGSPLIGLGEFNATIHFDSIAPAEPACCGDDECDDGLFCNGAETCNAGVCTPGAYACLPGQACDETADMCLAFGTCVTDGQCNDFIFCNGPEVCMAGDCESLGFPCDPGEGCDEQTEECGPCTSDAQCNDFLFCTGTETCDNGVCQPGTAPCTGLQICNENQDSCQTFCVSSNDCTDGLFCNGAEQCIGNLCVPGQFPCMGGQGCDEGADACGPCANDAQCDDGVFCNGVETCDAGVCQPGTFPCMAGEGCNESVDACGPCSSDAQCHDFVFCNGAETCDAGVCQPAADPCAPGEVCNEDADACQTNCLSDMDCEDDLFCTGVESCINDVCVPGTFPCTGGLGCDDDNDICRPCVIDAECNDFLFCNGIETCDGGVCMPGDFPCMGGLGCNESTNNCVPCSVDSECDDGRFCNGDESCVAGVCLPGDFPCSGGDGCDEIVDTCGPCATDEQCDDGLFCTGVESCVAGVCMSSGFPCTGGDGCQESADTCGPCAGDGECNDFLFCNGMETCNGGVCSPGMFPCSGGQGCDEPTDACGPCTTDQQCDDGLFCTGAETCNAGLCESEGNPCGPDVCTEETDSCATLRIAVVPVTEMTTGELTPELPPARTRLRNQSTFFAEIWAQAADESGLECVYSDLDMDDPNCETPVEAITHSALYGSGTSGTIAPPRSIDEFGGCTIQAGRGIAPEWILLGRIEMTGGEDCTATICTEAADTPSRLMDGTLLDPAQVSYGCADVEFFGCIYDLDGDGLVGPGDFALFNPCWLCCEGSSCWEDNSCSEKDFDCDGCVGPGDFAFFNTAWLRACGDPNIVYPPCFSRSGIELPPASPALLREFGLRVPPPGWPAQDE
jgi:hypothetical protein